MYTDILIFVEGAEREAAVPTAALSVGWKQGQDHLHPNGVLFHGCSAHAEVGISLGSTCDLEGIRQWTVNATSQSKCNKSTYS